MTSNSRLLPRCAPSSKAIFTLALAFLACAACSADCRKSRPAPLACDPLAMTECPPEMESASVVAQGTPTRVSKKNAADGSAEMTSRAVLGPYVLTCTYPMYVAPDAPEVGLETCKLTEPGCTHQIAFSPHVPARTVALRKTDRGVLGVTLQLMGSSRGVPLGCFERKTAPR